MKKLAVLFVMSMSLLLTGTSFAAQDRPTERSQGNRIHPGRMGERGRVLRRHHRRNRRHHVMNQGPGERRGRGTGNYRPPTP
jgi:hypothetical protein